MFKLLEDFTKLYWIKPNSQRFFFLHRFKKKKKKSPGGTTNTEMLSKEGKAILQWLIALQFLPPGEPGDFL